MIIQLKLNRYYMNYHFLIFTDLILINIILIIQLKLNRYCINYHNNKISYFTKVNIAFPFFFVAH